MGKAAPYTAAALLAVISVAHWIRLFLQTEVIVAGYPVPMRLSLIAGIVFAALALWMAAAARRP